MKLSTHILIHLIISVFCGLIVWIFIGNLLLSISSAVFGGVFIDLDHLIDYIIAFGLKPKLKYFLTGFSFKKNNKIIILFHSVEISLFIIFLGLIVNHSFYKTIALSFGLASLGHLITDSLINDLPFKSYFMMKRLKVKFNLKKLKL